MDGNIHITTSVELQEKAIKATATFLERGGDEILDAAWESDAGRIDVVSRDANGVIRFVFVRVDRGFLPKMVEMTDRIRQCMEVRAVMWLRDHRDAADCMLAFDIADLGVIGSDRAIMRVHRNALGDACPFTGGDLLARSEMRAASIPDDAVKVDACDDVDSSSDEDSDE